MKKKWIGAGISLLVALCVIFALIAGSYHAVFAHRFETAERKVQDLGDFPDLQYEDVTFPSNKGQRLAGRFYLAQQEPKGIVVVVHGFGRGGLKSHIDVCDYFTRHGYTAFSYDATAYDSSQGRSSEGIPQGVIDLDYAIRFIEQSQYAGLPIMLWGHSWGGYCVSCQPAIHPEVAAVVSVAGFNSLAGVIRARGADKVGKLARASIPFVKLYEKIKFGKYAGLTGVKGLRSFDGGVLILQGGRDRLIDPSLGYDIYMKKFGEDPRFQFIFREKKKHENVYYKKGIHSGLHEETMMQMVELFDQYAERSRT